MADLTDKCSGSGITQEVAKGYRWRIEMMYRDLLAKELVGGLCTQETGALAYLSQAYHAISEFVDSLQSSVTHLLPTQAQVVRTGTVGPPSFDIPQHQLQYLIENRFSVPQIAQLMGVSVSTIRQRMSDFNLSIRATYYPITDEQLDQLIAGVQQQFPNWGNRQMYGYLISHGMRVQFHRVRESQSRIDPEGSMMRRLHYLHRRCYSVRGPQHLWHVDGNHKLIRYMYM